MLNPKVIKDIADIYIAKHADFALFQVIKHHISFPYIKSMIATLVLYLYHEYADFPML